MNFLSSEIKSSWYFEILIRIMKKKNCDLCNIQRNVCVFALRIDIIYNLLIISAFIGTIDWLGVPLIFK